MVDCVAKANSTAIVSTKSHSVDERLVDSHHFSAVLEQESVGSLLVEGKRFGLVVSVQVRDWFEMLMCPDFSV